jgi:mono/diheme cytochrome c family protein
VLFAAFATSLTVSACGGGSSGSSAPAPAVTAAPVGPPGAATYQRSCARCHGADGSGKGSTPALDSVRLASLGDQMLQLTIVNGKGEMPRFTGLTQQQIDELIVYLRSIA